MDGRKHSESGELENLTESVGRVAVQLQLVGDSLDALRDDLNWLTRNPLRVDVQTALGSSDSVRSHRAGGLDEEDVSGDVSAAVGRLMSSLRQVLTTVTGEQLEAVIATLDEAHGHLLQLMRGNVREALHAGHAIVEAAPPHSGTVNESFPGFDEPSGSESAAPASAEVLTQSSAATPPKHRGPPGRLF